MTTKPDYPVVLRPLNAADGGGWIVIVPDLPGCMSDGETAHDALMNAELAINEWKDAARSMGRPIPCPDDSLQTAFEKTVPDHIRRQAEDYAKLMTAGAPGAPDLTVVHAIIAAWAKAAAEQVRLS